MQGLLIGWSVVCLVFGMILAGLLALADNPVAPRSLTWGEIWRCVLLGLALATVVWFFGCTAMFVGREIISLIAGAHE